MSIRYFVTYTRIILGSAGRVETVKRHLHAVSIEAARTATKRLPRHIDTLCIRESVETPAEAAARWRRENDAPVPHGC